MFKEQDNVYNGEGLPSLHDDSPVDKSASCCGRLCAELNPCGHAIFSVIDPATKRTIDIPASFAPDSGRYHGTLLVKLFLFALGWATFGYGMSVGAVPGFYFA